MEICKMANDLITQQTRGLIPTNIEEAYRMAKAFSIAKMLPKSYGDGDIDVMTAKAFTAMQLGAEVGMSPMQSIQSIAVVNGMPTIWGDAQKALVINSPLCEYIKESFAGEPYEDSFKAICKVKRVGHDEIVAEFSVADAKAAQLWSKSGTWQTHKKRMMQYKARSFALRDGFPDVLKGLTHSAEEMEGIEDVTPYNNNTPIAAKKERKEATEINAILSAQSTVIDMPVNQEPIQNAALKRATEIKTLISGVENLAELKKHINENQTHITMMPDDLSKEIYAAIELQKSRFGMAQNVALFSG